MAFINDVLIGESKKRKKITSCPPQERTTVETVEAKSASRALGSIINKYYKLGGLGYYIYTKMFMSGIAPILDYNRLGVP